MRAQPRACDECRWSSSCLSHQTLERTETSSSQRFLGWLRNTERVLATPLLPHPDCYVLEIAIKNLIKSRLAQNDQNIQEDLNNLALYQWHQCNDTEGSLGGFGPTQEINGTCSPRHLIGWRERSCFKIRFSFRCRLIQLVKMCCYLGSSSSTARHAGRKIFSSNNGKGPALVCIEYSNLLQSFV